MANSDPVLSEQVGTPLAGLQPSEAAAATPGPEVACDPSRPMMTEERRGQVLVRLAKVAGQVQGVSRMVDADRYCLDVLNQIAAAQKALDGVARIITRNYLERCVTDAITGGDPLIYDELMQVIDRRR